MASVVFTVSGKEDLSDTEHGKFGTQLAHVFVERRCDERGVDALFTSNERSFGDCDDIYVGA